MVGTAAVAMVAVAMEVAVKETLEGPRLHEAAASREKQQPDCC